MQQRTILREVSLKGKALHTGDDVELTFKPAPANTGVVFRRVDLYNSPEIRPLVENVSELVRSTTITNGTAKIHTVEHVLSALFGMGIDNVYVDLNASEPPILDGSAKAFVEALDEAGAEEQDAERKIFKLQEPISVTDGNRSIIALPHDGLRITCTSADDRGIHTQHITLDIDPDVYLKEIAGSRTFTIYEEIEQLLKMGKIQGGSLDSAIVIKGDKILSKEPLRFKDEFVRHKILDILGDITLLGQGLNAHIIAVRTGHALNAELTRRLHEVANAPVDKKPEPKPEKVEPQVIVGSDVTELDIRQILNTLPHRSPFMLVDRVTHIGEDDLTAIKCVSYNEPFFPGHFPGEPVMPGVLQLEAMAQAAGLLMLKKAQLNTQVAYFMSADKVKFRAPVVPGDVLEIKVKITKIRGNKIGMASGQCLVNGKPVSSADLMFTFVVAED